MDIKDTKEFDEKFGDSFRGGDMNSFESAEPIKEYIIQDRIKLTLAILDNDIERLYKDNLLLIYQIEKDKLFSKGGSVKLKEYNFIEKIITYKKEQRELINKQN